MTPEVAVIGAGSWGTTVASLAASHTPTVLWARRAETAEEVATAHTNSRYLGDAPLAPALRATADLAEAVSAADILIMGIPSHGFRATLAEMAPHMRPGRPVISLSKGLEPETRLRMTEVVAEVTPDHPAGVLTGPNLAKEVLAGQSAAAVVAMPDEQVARTLQEVLSRDVFKIYRSTDVVGAEIAGALKNVFAIAAGIAAGLGSGDNTRALVMCRAIAEITESMQQVAEGIKASRSIVRLAEEYDVEMPIAAEVDAVVNHGRTPQEAFQNLLERVPTIEFEGVLLR